jgi:nicotinate phosphoribosyltransferase
MRNIIIREEKLMERNINLTMLTDFYELTMANGYFENGFKDRLACFDLFFRKLPDNGGFAILAGVQDLINYINNLKFSVTDIDYLREKKLFSEGFLQYLKNFKFTCDIWAIPEGTPIFPNDPLVTVIGPLIEAQFIETMALLIINHQSLIATKANRIVRAAKGKAVMEFGSRRAQGADGAILGARAAFIGGCIGTACTLAEKEYGIPAIGTMAHSWVQIFPTELDAFRAYAKTYPDNSTFLVDTYNVLKSGVPNAIKIFNEEIVSKGYRPKGIRIDSGDIAYLSRKSRKMLDDAGFRDCKIVASNSLDEYIIRDLLEQNAEIDLFGVGERLITSKSDPIFGGVYKLSAFEEEGVLIPKIKISENVGKITIPGFKVVWRLYDKDSGKAIADVITLAKEIINEDEPFEIFDSEFSWKRKSIVNFTAKKILTKIFEKGKCIYKEKSLIEVKDYCKAQINTLWDEILRFENPHRYYVDLSEQLWKVREKLILKHRDLE